MEEILNGKSGSGLPHLISSQQQQQPQPSHTPPTSNNVSLEDTLRERLKQIILQSTSFKRTLKLNALLAIEIDDEPQSCVVINDLFTPTDRARLWFPLFGLDPSATNTNLSAALGVLAQQNLGQQSVELANAYLSNTLASIQQSLPFLQQTSQDLGGTNSTASKVTKPNTNITTGSKRKHGFSSNNLTQQLSLLTSSDANSNSNTSPQSKRKAGKPCRIPPSAKEDDGEVLDLSKTEGGGTSYSDGNQQHSVDLSNQISKLNGNDYYTTKQGTDDLLSNHYRTDGSIFYNDQSFSNLGFDTNPMFISNETSIPVFPPMTSFSTSKKQNNNNINSVLSTAPSSVTPKKRIYGPGSGTKRSGVSKVFACNQCKEQFSSLTALCKHTFSEHRAFKCNICGANFTQRSNLQRHSLKHVGFKPFICNVCNKSYYRKDHLVRHIEVTHSEVNPKESITVKLTSSECLEYLEKMHEEGKTSQLIDRSPSGAGSGKSPTPSELERLEALIISRGEEANCNLSPAVTGEADIDEDQVEVVQPVAVDDEEGHGGELNPNSSERNYSQIEGPLTMDEAVGELFAMDEDSSLTPPQTECKDEGGDSEHSENELVDELEENHLFLVPKKEVDINENHHEGDDTTASTEFELCDDSNLKIDI